MISSTEPQREHDAAPRRGNRAQGAPLLRLEVSPRGVVAIVIALATLWALVRLWQVVILLIISAMLAAALLPFVDWLMRRGLGRGQSVAVIALLAIGLLAGAGVVVVPAVVGEAQALSDRAPQLKSDIARVLREHGQERTAADVERFNVSDVLQRDQVVNYSQRVINVLIAAITVIVLTIYMLLDTPRITRFFFFATPDRYHEHVNNLLPALRTTVGGFVRGQLVTSAIITAYTFVVLYVLGVPSAAGLAVLAGIADIVPLIGAFIAVIPGALAALNVSVTAALIVLVALVLYQQFEDRILTPRVYGATLRLPAIAVFLAVIIGATLMGILGAVLALPAASALRVCIMYAHAVRQGRVAPVAPEDELLAPDEGEDTSAATA
jgi:predicted PurR-regulated permease PerM